MSGYPFSVITSRRWIRDDGRTASIYGACPWTSEAERARWRMEQVGWTTLDARDGTTGQGHKALPTQAEAQERADRWNAEHAERMAAWERARASAPSPDNATPPRSRRKA